MYVCPYVDRYTMVNCNYVYGGAFCVIIALWYVMKKMVVSLRVQNVATGHEKYERGVVSCKIINIFLTRRHNRIF